MISTIHIMPNDATVVYRIRKVHKWSNEWRVHTNIPRTLRLDGRHVCITRYMDNGAGNEALCSTFVLLKFLDVFVRVERFYGLDSCKNTNPVFFQKSVFLQLFEMILKINC